MRREHQELLNFLAWCLARRCWCQLFHRKDHCGHWRQCPRCQWVYPDALEQSTNKLLNYDNRNETK